MIAEHSRLFRAHQNLDVLVLLVKQAVITLAYEIIQSNAVRDQHIAAEARVTSGSMYSPSRDPCR